MGAWKGGEAEGEGQNPETTAGDEWGPWQEEGRWGAEESRRPGAQSVPSENVENGQGRNRCPREDRRQEAKEGKQ